MKVYNIKKIENFESSINSIANNLEIALDYNPLSKNCYRIKLKKGSKAANRRKSFCARMGGMKKRLTSAKTARDPDSRINKALRKWNC